MKRSLIHFVYGVRTCLNSFFTWAVQFPSTTHQTVSFFSLYSWHFCRDQIKPFDMKQIGFMDVLEKGHISHRKFISVESLNHADSVL